MSSTEPDPEEEDVSAVADAASLAAFAVALKPRCDANGISFEERKDEEFGPSVRIGFKNGRDKRWLTIWRPHDAEALLSVEFEKYSFVSDFVATCSYSDDVIEASIITLRPTIGTSYLSRRIFGIEYPDNQNDSSAAKIILEAPRLGLPEVELSAPSREFAAIAGRQRASWSLTLKLSGARVSTHDEATDVLTRLSSSLFFQLELISDIALALRRRRPIGKLIPSVRDRPSAREALQFPKEVYDEAPLSLYFYGRSAVGMPLLQFLAFYQVIEFYYPVYSRAEATRKLKGILKDPTFRVDRDLDVGKLLSAIHISRSGAFGDERSQLRNTVLECVDPDMLRAFFEQESERKEFYSGKQKSGPYHRIPIANSGVDLRNDVADRIYDIRCKIVHTKTGSDEKEFELLLPNSKEFEQLAWDIDLVRYISQRVLISASVTNA